MAAISFSIFVLNIILFAVPVRLQWDEDKRELQCHGETFINGNKFLRYYKACHSDLKKENRGKEPQDIKKIGMTCELVCALTKEGLFDAEGRFQEAKLNVTVDKYVPLPYAKSVREEVTFCARAANIYEAMNVPYDPICNKVYKRFLRCIVAAYRKVCTDETPIAIDYSKVPSGK